AKNYARALFGVAQTRGRIDEIADDLQAVDSAFQQDKMLAFFSNPRINMEDKLELIDSLSTVISEEIINLLKLLLKRDRQKELQAIGREYVSFANEARG